MIGLWCSRLVHRDLFSNERPPSSVCVAFQVAIQIGEGGPIAFIVVGKEPCLKHHLQQHGEYHYISKGSSQAGHQEYQKDMQDPVLIPSLQGDSIVTEGLKVLYLGLAQRRLHKTADHPDPYARMQAS